MNNPIDLSSAPNTFVESLQVNPRFNQFPNSPTKSAMVNSTTQQITILPQHGSSQVVQSPSSLSHASYTANEPVYMLPVYNTNEAETNALNGTNGPFLMQLDDNSYVYVEGIEHVPTTKAQNTCTSTIQQAVPQLAKTSTLQITKAPVSQPVFTSPVKSTTVSSLSISSPARTSLPITVSSPLKTNLVNPTSVSQRTVIQNFEPNMTISYANTQTSIAATSVVTKSNAAKTPQMTVTKTTPKTIGQHKPGTVKLQDLIANYVKNSNNNQPGQKTKFIIKTSLPSSSAAPSTLTPASSGTHITIQPVPVTSKAQTPLTINKCPQPPTNTNTINLNTKINNFTLTTVPSSQPFTNIIPYSSTSLPLGDKTKTTYLLVPTTKPISSSQVKTNKTSPTQSAMSTTNKNLYSLQIVNTPNQSTNQASTGTTTPHILMSNIVLSKPNQTQSNLQNQASKLTKNSSIIVTSSASLDKNSSANKDTNSINGSQKKTTPIKKGCATYSKVNPIITTPFSTTEKNETHLSDNTTSSAQQSTESISKSESNIKTTIAPSSSTLKIGPVPLITQLPKTKTTAKPKSKIEEPNNNSSTKNQTEVTSDQNNQSSRVNSGQKESKSPEVSPKHKKGVTRRPIKQKFTLLSDEAPTKKAKLDETPRLSSANTDNKEEKIDETGKKIIKTKVGKASLQPTDTGIINTAFHELRKLFAKRELLLKHLKNACLNLGKVDYKLTISGSPIDIEAMHNRLINFKNQFSEDLKQLDLAINAMTKLHAQLEPKDNMRSTEDILKDLVEPVEGTCEDPKAKYERIRVLHSPNIPKRPQGRPRTRKIVTKKPEKSDQSSSDVSPQRSSFQPMIEKTEPNPKDGKYYCYRCDSVFFKEMSLKTHIEYDHLERSSQTSQRQEEHCKFSCDICDKNFRSNVVLMMHRSDDHETGDSYELSRKARANQLNETASADEACYNDFHFNNTKNVRTYSRFTPKSESSSALVKRGNIRGRGRGKGRGRDRGQKAKQRKSVSFLLPPKTAIFAENSTSVEPVLFDPDIPIECTEFNPIILLKPLSPEIIAAYVNDPMNSI